MLRAHKLQKRAATVGFDWTEPGPVLGKVEEELAEIRAAMAAGDGKIDRASANIPVLHPDGTILRVAVRLLVVHDGRDRAVGAMAIFCADDEAAPPLPRL